MATTQVETVSTGADKAKLAAAAAWLWRRWRPFICLANRGSWFSGVLCCWVWRRRSWFFSPPSRARRLYAFGRDAWREVKKVVWPARKEAIQMTAYVFGFALLMALFLWLTDKTLEWLFYDLILGWKK